MTHDFWLGVGVLPGLAAIGLGLWFVLRSLNHGGAWLVNRLRFHHPKQPTRRAQLGAVMACARRTWWLKLPFDSLLVLVAGHDFEQVEPIHEAIYGVIAKPPTVNPRYLRRATVKSADTPTDTTEEN